MKKLLFTFALACIGLSATSQVIRRSWSGEMEVMGQKLPIVMNMINGQCTLDSPMQGATDIPATVLLLTKDSIKIICLFILFLSLFLQLVLILILFTSGIIFTIVTAFF